MIELLNTSLRCNVALGVTQSVKYCQCVKDLRLGKLKWMSNVQDALVVYFFGTK